MPIRSVLAACAALAAALAGPAPAGATVVTWRATGSVASLSGNPSLLPFPAAAVGNTFVLEVAYDDSAADLLPLVPDHGSYPILSLVVSVGAETVEYVNEVTGAGTIGIQANAVDPNLWGVSGCLPGCSNVQSYDSARFNLFFPAGTIASDVLTPPPDAAGADTVQFGLFSREPADEAFLVASLQSVVEVPAPSAGASLPAAAAALAGLRSRRRASA